MGSSTMNTAQINFPSLIVGSIVWNTQKEIELTCNNLAGEPYDFATTHNMLHRRSELKKSKKEYKPKISTIEKELSEQSR